MNIVLVISDKNRRDNFSCYGPTVVRTPRLDQFAATSYVFDNAYLGSYPTVPHRLDLMTGRFSHTDHEWCPLPDDAVTLQQVLTASGFVTQMIFDNPHLLENGYNYSRGFGGFEWIRGHEADPWRTAPRQVRLPINGKKNRGLDFLLPHYCRNTAWWRGEQDRFAPRTILAACRWLEENRDQDRFFLYLDLFDPHEPFDPPENYLALYEKGYQGDEILCPHYGFWREFLTEDELNHVRNLYMAKTTMVDHWFGVLLDKLTELGLAENTAVIFTSDHGHLFGEHDILGMSLIREQQDRVSYEAVPMYDELRRIPLFVHLPDQTQGRHLAGIVQAPDLMPTILEMAGLVATGSVQGRTVLQTLQCGVFMVRGWRFQPEKIHGRSLMPMMRGGTAKLREIAVCSNTLVHPTSMLAKSAIVTEDGWCLHYSGRYDVARGRDFSLYTNRVIEPDQSRISTEPALYRLTEDPRESGDVLHQNIGLACEIHSRYVGWLEAVGTPEVYLAHRRVLR